MFTGLVEALGIVAAVKAESGGGLLFVIEVPPAWTGTLGAGTLGESVAINGCCLTAIALEGNRWSFQAGTETLSKTNLGELQPGNRVNLERALPANGRLGGHFVQGHVDGTGTVAGIERDGDWTTMWFQAPEPLLPQMVPKGSIAIDGVSLTVVEIVEDRFSVALIPHTLAVTTLGEFQEGRRINLETDILGKYVQRLMQPGIKIA